MIRVNGFVIRARSCVAASYPQVDVAFLGGSVAGSETNYTLDCDEPV